MKKTFLVFKPCSHKYEHSETNGPVTRFSIKNPSVETKVWNVTNIMAPIELQTSNIGSQLAFTDSSAVCQEYVAFQSFSELACSCKDWYSPKSEPSLHPTS